MNNIIWRGSHSLKILNIMFLVGWVDVHYNLCVCTDMQVAKFLLVHLVVGGWYLDCFHGLVFDVEETLYNNLVSSALEENNQVHSSNENKVAKVKVKGKGMKVGACAL